MSYILLDSKAYLHNLDIISKHIHSHSPHVQIAAVLKDNAYGHGLIELASLSLKYGIKHVFVKNYQEALKIENSLKGGFDSITSLYGGASAEPLGDSIGKIPSNIAMTINSLDAILALPAHTKVELKVNTGMNRNGIQIENIPTFIDAICRQDLELYGVFTHNGYGDEWHDDKSDERYLAQRETFRRAKDMTKNICHQKGIKIPRFHSLSSSGALQATSIDDDLVRMGIASYGYLGCNIPIKNDLRHVLSLWADKICSKELSPGDAIGYGGKSTSSSAQEISTYDIGYGDGFLRINERFAGELAIFTPDKIQILPRTSMDCLSAFSTQKSLCIFDDAEYIADKFDTISYEILTSLSPFIHRKII